MTATKGITIVLSCMETVATPFFQCMANLHATRGSRASSAGVRLAGTPLPQAGFGESREDLKV